VGTRKSSIFTQFKWELEVYSHLLGVVDQVGLASNGPLWVKRERFALDPSNTETYQKDWNYLDLHIREWLPFVEGITTVPIHSSRLGMVIEGGGQRSFFAIGNSRNQRLLRPSHSWAMEVLSRLKNDGTLLQDQPLKFLEGQSQIFRLDLKSATDRWPIMLFYSIMHQFFGPKIGQSVTASTNTLNVFQSPIRGGKTKKEKKGSSVLRLANL